jgi:plastocyanin
MMPMMKAKRHVLALCCTGLLVVGITACGGGDDADDASSDTTTATSAATATTPTNESTSSGGAEAAAVAVTIEGFAFDAKPVAAGQSFDVENKDTTDHTFTADDGAFDVRLGAGETKSVDGLDAGTYAYHCTIHASMKGTLEVT